MTTARGVVPSAAQHNDSHDPAAVCCWCSDQVPWWAGVRAKHGLDAPPYARERIGALVARAATKRGQQSAYVLAIATEALKADTRELERILLENAQRINWKCSRCRRDLDWCECWRTD